MTTRAALAAARGWRILSGGRCGSTKKQGKFRPIGTAMCSLPSLPLLALCNDLNLPPSLADKLRRLNADQLMLLEILAAGLLSGRL